MSREHLPNRRSSSTLAFRHGNVGYRATVSNYADGRLAEVFVNGDHIGASASTLMADCAIILSLALQYGCKAADIRPSLLREIDGKPLSPMGELLDLLEQDGVLS